MTLEFQTISELGKMIANPLVGHIDDVIVVNSNGDKIRIYVRHGAHLSAFNVSHRNETTWKRIASRKIFNAGQRESYPLRTYPWFVTETMLDDGCDVIIMRSEAGLVFYKFDPRKSNESLQELSRDTSFGDLYNWNEANLSAVLIGRFYPDNQLIGVMSRKKTRKDSVVEFYSVDKDRLMTSYPLFPLQESHYVDEEMASRISEAIDLYLADIEHNGQDNIILRTKYHQLEMYKFDDNYHLQQVAKLSLVDGSQTDERFFFVNLTGNSYRDVVHFNRHGLYVYQINNNTDYSLVHYHSGFSETNGWNSEYGESIQLVDTNSDGRDDLIFTGPKGLTVFEFDPETLGWKTLLDRSTQLAFSKRFSTVVAVVTSGAQSILVTIDKERQLFMDQLLTKTDPPKAFRQSIPSAVELINDNRKLCRHANIPTQVKRNVPEEHILRWTEQWTEHLSIPNLIDPVSGSLDFSLPIFQPEIFSDPVPYRLLLSYQSQLASLSNIVGSGWSISLPESCILVDYQGSIFVEDAKFYLAMGGDILQLKYFKVLEEDGVRRFREPLQPEWTVEYHEKQQRWIIATEMDTLIFGTKGKMEAVRWNLNYPRWRGPGNDAKSLQPIPVAWYLIERQIKDTGRSIFFEYEIDFVDYKNPSTKWTAAVRLNQISVESFTTLKFDYAPKEKEEYQLFEHPFDSRNYLVFPVPLRQSHYLRGCNIATQHYRQRLEFKYETDKGTRFLAAIEQPITAADVRESIFTFNYYNDKLNEIRSPVGLKYNFQYDTIPNIDLPDPYSIVEHPVEEKPAINYGHDYAALVFRQSQVPDMIQVKILGVDSHETLVELSPLAATAQPEVKVVSYNVRSHADFLVVLLDTNKEQKICLFHRNIQKGKMKWNRDPSCHRFNHEAIIRSSQAGVAVANSSKPGAVEIFELSSDQSKWIHHRLTSGRTAVIRFEMLGHLIVGYDDHQLFICNPEGTNKGNWKIRILERLVGLFSGGSAIVKKFQFPTETEKIFLDIITQNLMQLSANSIAVSSLHLNDDHQLLLRIRLFLLNSNYNRSRRREFAVQAENVLELRSEFQNLDSRYQFGYRITDDGFYRVKLFNLAGNEVDTILTAIKEKRVKEFEKLECEWKKNVTIRREEDFKSFDSQMQMKLENFKHLVRNGASGNETEETQNESNQENKSCDDVIFSPCNRQCYEMEESIKGDDIANEIIKARQKLDECYADDWKKKWENNVKMEGEKLKELNEKGEKEILELEADWVQRGMDMSSGFNVTQELLRDRENAFTGLFLLNWSGYQTRMIAEGFLVSNDTFIRMRGDDWEKETVNNKPFINEMSIPLGTSFVLMMDESNKNEFQPRNITLYAQGQNQSIGSPLHRLLGIQQIVNRYPVYLAYENENSTKVILFNDDGKTLGNVLTFSNEQLVSEMSSYQRLTTLFIAMPISTSQIAEKMKLVTRSVRSMNPVTDAKRIVVRQVKTSNSDASLTRSTGYQWDIDANGNVTVTTIPGNDRKLAGWLKETWTRASGRWVRKALQMFDADGQSVEASAQSIEKSDDPSDSSILWDSSKRRIISDFSPYRISDQMVSYCGFEYYEVNISPWQFVQSNVIKSGFALTGSNFLRLENSMLQGTFTPVDQKTNYVASCWIRPSDGFLESSTEQDLEITAHLKATVKVKETGEEIVGLWGRTMRKSADWFYLEVLVDFDIVKRLFSSRRVDERIPPFTITIKVEANHKTIDVDHVRFSPMAHDFKATVYRHQRPVSVIGSSGSISQTVYYRGREMAVATDGQLEQVTSSSYTGRLVPAPKGSSLTAAPPCRIVFYPENGGLLENFDSYSFRNRWKDCSTDFTSTWTIAPGRLRHNHQQSNRIVSVDPSFLFGEGSSAAVRSYYSLESSTSSMTWKWNNGQVLLSRNSTELLSTLNVTFENQSLDPVTHLPNYGELILMAEGHRFFVWIDSVLLLDVVVASNANWTSFAFEAQGNCFVEDCVFMANPRTEIEYMNDWGDKMQTIQLESEFSVLVSQILYDSLGRPAITTKLTRVTVVDGRKSLLNYHSNFISSPIDPADPLSVWQSHRLRGEVDRLNSLDGGVAYFRIIYETNPLNEKQAIGQPGLDFAVNGPYATKFRSSIKKDNISVVLNHFPIHRGFRHRMEEMPNGTKKVVVLDGRGNTVALYVYTPGYDHLLSTYEYDSHNRLVKMLPPLYHERVDTFGKSSFNSETSSEEIRLQETFGTFMSYDRETGRLIRKTTPDTGTVEYYHNSAGQIRLQVHSTFQESEEIDSVVYYEYDGKGVVSRTGFLEQMPITRQQFEKSLQQGTLSNAKDYQLIDRTEVEERHYDPSLSGGERNATFVIQDDHILVEDMRWDSQDRLLEYKRVGCGNWQIRKMFHPQNSRLQSIQYPSGLKLKHRYNKLGQLIGLQLDGQSENLVSFTYGGSGQLRSEYHLAASRYGFNRTFHYNSPGYLEQITDPYLTENVSYTAGGYGQGGSGDGIVMQTRFNATWPTNSDWRWFQLSNKSIPASCCLKALERNGYITKEGRPIKDYYPAAVDEKNHNSMPLVCGGGNGQQISRMLAQKRMPRIYGHRYAYGNHQELVKAKYFTEETETFAVPFQPDTLADQTALNKQKSREIWKQIEEAGFIMSDQRKADWLTVVANRGSQSLVRKNDLNDLLLSANTYKDDVTIYQDRIETMILNYFGQRRDPIPKLDEFQKIFCQWKGVDYGCTNMAQLGRTAENIHKDLSKVKGNASWLNAKLVEIFRPYSKHFPDFIRILNQRLAYGLGEHPFDVASYDIDANGNHAKFLVGFNIYKLKYGNIKVNQIRSVKIEKLGKLDGDPDKAMDHDSRGNVIKALHKDIERIEYNGASMRTSAIHLTDGRKVRFAYDGQGERILKRVLDKDGQLMNETEYVRDEDGRVLFDRRSTYSSILKNVPLVIVQTAYVYGPRGLVGFIRNGAFHSVWTDHSGSIRLILKDGQVVAAYDYLPYGQLMRSYGNDPASEIFYRYTGQEWDQETGLYNYHARLYDPDIGRFYQPDAREQYFSPYKYVGNSPVSLVDPDGEFAFVFAISMAVLALGGAFLGGAAVNKKWNPREWDWKSGRTWGAILGGGIGGALMPGFAATAVATVGIPATALAAVGVAYFSAATKNNNFDLTKWNWKDPDTYNAIFEGVGNGVGIFGGAAMAHQFANKFGTIGKNLILTGSYSSAIGFAYWKGVSSNEGKWDLSKWDWSNPDTYNALLQGFDSGIGLPSDMTQIGRGIYKLAAKNPKQLKTIMSMLDHVKMNKFKPILASIAKGPVGKAATGALTAYFMTSAANENFNPKGWDGTAINTYEGFLNGLFLGVHARKIVQTLARKKSRPTAEPSHSIESISKVPAMGQVFDNLWKVMIQSEIQRQTNFKLSQETVALSLLRPDGFGLQYSITKDQKSFSNIKEDFQDGADQLTTIENANNRKRKRQNEIFTDDESLMLGCLPGKRRRKRAESRKRPATCRISNPDVEMQKKMKEDPVSVLNQAAISTKSITDHQDFKRLKIPFFNGGTYPFQLIPGASGSSYHLKVGMSHNDVSTVHGYWMNTKEKITINPMEEIRFIFTSELQGCSIYIKYHYDAVGQNGQHEPKMTVYHHNRQFPDTIYLENGRYVHDGIEIDELNGVKELFDDKGNILKAENGAIVPAEKIYYVKSGEMKMVAKLNKKEMDGIIKNNVKIKNTEDKLAAEYDQVIRYEDYFALPGNYNEKMAKLGQPLTFVTPVLYRDKDGHWYFSSQKISYTKGLLDKENFQMHSKLGRNFLQNSNKRLKVQDLLFQYQIGPSSANKVNSDLFIKQLGSIPRSLKEASSLAKRKFPSQKEYKEFMQSLNEARSRKPAPAKRSNVIDVGDLDLESLAKRRRPPRSALHKFDDVLEFKMISSGASHYGSWIDLLSTGRHIVTSILSLNHIKKFVKMSLLPLLLPDESDDAAGRNDNELFPRLAANRSDYRDVSIGNCHSMSPDAVVCNGYFGKTTVITNCKKVDNVKQDTYSHCRPVEWHGEPSVTCRGEKTTFIHTPYNRNSAAVNLFNAVDGWLILAKTAPGIYRELVKFASHLKNVWKGSSKEVNMGISDKDKESWKMQLIYLEELVAKQQQVDWALPLLRELQQQVSSLSGKTHTETMDDVRAVKTMAERLSALTEDIEQNQTFYDCQEELAAVDEPQIQFTSAELLSTRLHHLTHYPK